MWLNPSRKGSSLWLQERQASHRRGSQPPASLLPCFPASRSHQLPHPLCPEALQCGHARLSASAPLGHALNAFQGVDIEAVHTAGSEAHHLLDLGSSRHLDLRQTARHRYGGTGHESELQFPRGLDHLLGPLPFPGQVFIVENRDAATAFAENLDHLLEEFVLREKRLPFLVLGIATMLGNQ